MSFLLGYFIRVNKQNCTFYKSPSTGNICYYMWYKARLYPHVTDGCICMWVHVEVTLMLTCLKCKG